MLRDILIVLLVASLTVIQACDDSTRIEDAPLTGSWISHEHPVVLLYGPEAGPLPIYLLELRADGTFELNTVYFDDRRNPADLTRVEHTGTFSATYTELGFYTERVRWFSDDTTTVQSFDPPEPNWTYADCKYQIHGEQLILEYHTFQLDVADDTIHKYERRNPEH